MMAEAVLAMPVTIICPKLTCRKILSVPDDLRGKAVKCQHCQTPIRVPAGDEKKDAVAKPASR